MPENASLSAKQLQVIAHLVAGETILAAAQACKVNEATVHRWKKVPAFRDGLYQAQNEMLDAALGKLVRYVSSAIDTLARNLLNDSGAEAPIRGVQVRAAQAILDATLTVHRSDEIDRRLKQLEERQD